VYQRYPASFAPGKSGNGAPPPRAGALDYLDIAMLFACLALATWIVLRRRERREVVLLGLFSLLYFGFWRNGCVCAIGSIQNLTQALFDPGYALPLTVLVFGVLPLVFALFFGRVFCAAVCPHGAFQDVMLLRPVRLPVWQSLVSPFAAGAPENDFTDVSGQHYVLTSFWNGSYGYSAETRPNTTPKGYYDAVVTPPVSLVKGLAGSRSPDQRQYHASFLTNYQFATGKLRGFAVGGSERWESKAAIGYMGTVATPLTAPGVVNLNDVTRPVYDSGNYYTDLFVSYQRKIYNNKIGWKLQLNINNALENGGLRPTAVNLDGSIYGYRIIDSRQFVLTSTFTF